MTVFKGTYDTVMGDIVGGVKIMHSIIWGTYDHCNMELNQR